MKILQLTDIHLTAPGETIGNRDPNANFVKALDHALHYHSDADCMVITGDLSDWGDASDYNRMKTIIGDIGLPVHLCIGNHDDRPTLLRSFPELEGDGGFVHYTFELPSRIGPHTGIVLDTWGPDTHEGHFCESRLDWFEQVLGSITNPAFVFMHHNFVPNRMAPLDSIMLQQHEAFGAVVARHSEKIRHIAHGHCHLPMSGNFHGVSFSAPRGTNHSGWFNFAEGELLTGSELPEAYCVIRADSHSVLTQMVEYGYTGELRTEASPDYKLWDRQTMAR